MGNSNAPSDTPPPPSINLSGITYLNNGPDTAELWSTGNVFFYKNRFYNGTKYGQDIILRKSVSDAHKALLENDLILYHTDVKIVFYKGVPLQVDACQMEAGVGIDDLLAISSDRQNGEIKNTPEQQVMTYQDNITENLLARISRLEEKLM